MSDQPWIVVGGSPGAPASLAAALERYPDARTAATNMAVRLFVNRRLDYYFISDQNACRIYHDQMIEAQKRGTKIVTWRRGPKALETRGLAGADILLEMDYVPTQPAIYQPGRIVTAQFSGLTLLQYALTHKPPLVCLVGMEGYRSLPGDLKPEYFDGSTNKRKTFGGQDYTDRFLKPFIQSVINAMPDVVFEFYGDLAYEITGQNVRLLNNENQVCA